MAATPRAVLGSLTAGFSSHTATRAHSVLDSYLYGFALQELSLPFEAPEELSAAAETMLRQIPGDEYPHLRDVATEFAASGFVYADESELDLILDGLESPGQGLIVACRGGDEASHCLRLLGAAANRTSNAGALPPRRGGD